MGAVVRVWEGRELEKSPCSDFSDHATLLQHRVSAY